MRLIMGRRQLTHCALLLSILTVTVSLRRAPFAVVDCVRVSGGPAPSISIFALNNALVAASLT